MFHSLVNTSAMTTVMSYVKRHLHSLFQDRWTLTVSIPAMVKNFSSTSFTADNEP